MQSVLNLTITTARNASKLQKSDAVGSELPLLERGLYRAAAAAACNHKDIASTSLTCISSIIGEYTPVLCHSQFHVEVNLMLGKFAS